uniref:STE20-related kinase adapter protein alpha n=1 Tax=Capra hircus TaxID=9925 RepID=A0A452FQ22_CAPHI
MASSESITSFSKQEIMSNFLLEGGCYELLVITGKGFEDLITVNLTKYKPMGEYVTVQRINLEARSSEMVTFLQQELHVSKFFSHANTLPYQAAFIADNELWLVAPFPAYGSAKDLIYTHFMDGMNELEIAYSLQGALRVHYTHHMGYVHRRVKTGRLHSDLTQQLSTISAQYFLKYSIKNLQVYDAKITACEVADGHVPFKDMPKLNSTVPCLLDNSTNLPEELTMSISYSAANYGLSDNLATSTPGTSDGDSPSHPYHHNFSPHFLHFVEQCTLCNPDIRPSASSLMNNSSFKQIKRHASEALPKFLHPSPGHSGIFEC